MSTALTRYAQDALDISSNGEDDNLPESAFLFVGTIDEAVEKAKGLGA